MRKMIGAIIAMVAIGSFSACAMETEENEPSDVAEQIQGLVTTADNSCWWTTAYQEWWVDPNNPSSGHHVVGWYQCADEFGSPLTQWAQVYTGTTYRPGWLVWQTGYRQYQVFIDGTYYWSQRALGFSPSYIFTNVRLK